MLRPFLPLIMYGPKVVSAFDSINKLSKVGEPFIREQWWRERLIIDCNCIHFEISSIKIIGNGNLIPHLFILPSRRIFNVDYQFNKVGTLSLDKVKEIIIKRLRSEHRPWAVVRDSNDIEEIINELGFEL